MLCRTSDLLHLLQPHASPFVINFSIIFADVAIGRVSAEDRPIVAAVAIQRCCEFPQFSAASNALLNYALSMLSALPASNTVPLELTQQVVLADWLLDVLLLQAPIERDAPGSVQPGLSVARANRLTEKTKKWTAAELLRTKQEVTCPCEPPRYAVQASHANLTHDAMCARATDSG